MSKIKWPKLKDLYGIKLVVSPHVPDDKLVLVGREEFKDPLHFSRKLSVLDLKTGKVSGSVHYGEVQVVHASESNKDMLEHPTNQPQEGNK